MLNVRSAFHLTHMVKDLDKTVRTYQNIFQPPVNFAPFHKYENRYAAFAFVSDVYIELFATLDAKSPNPTSAGARFIKRWGEGLQNFGWLIDGDMQEAIRFAESKGYQLAYVGAATPGSFFVHPRQASGIMLQIAGGTVQHDARTQPDWANRWRIHPLGIERTNCVSYAVRDLEGGVGFFQNMAGLPVIHRERDEAMGKDSAYLWAKTHIIEVMYPTSDEGELGRYVHDNASKIRSVTFKVRSIARAADWLRKRGVNVVGRPDAGYIGIDPADMLGAQYFFTERAIPNDPRGA